jgi:DNA-binding PadR family transcriptional regulator
MSPRRTLSPGLVAVLQAIASGTNYGFEIMDRTGLPGGTVYPALGRLQQLGYVRSSWERHSVAAREKRPPRRYYSLTDGGRVALRQAVEQYRALAGLVANGLDGLDPSRA